MPNDFLGQPITKGSYLVFPARYSSSMWLQVAKVVAVDGDKVTVRSGRVNWEGKLVVNSRNAVLQALDRTAVVSGVPEAIKTVLEGF